MVKLRTNLQRRRNRVFAILTLIFAAAWAGATWKVAGHIKTINLARLVGAAMTGSIADKPSVPRLRSNQLFPYIPVPSSQITEQEIESAKRIREQIAYVEGVVYVWETSMYLMVRFLVMTGLVSLMAGWARPLHLTAAILILLSTVGTLIGLDFLIDPDRGGLPRLSIWTHVMVAVVQSAYGVVLLAAFACKPKGPAVLVAEQDNVKPTEV